MNRKFVEVTLKTEADPGELLVLLSNAEALGAWEDDGMLRLYWPEEKWNAAAMEDLRRALSLLGVDRDAICPTVSVIQDRDWNAAWAASLVPIRLGRRIRVRQSWHSIDPEFKGIELIIDPKRAFGTGYHATTQMVVEWLEESIEGGERVLDIGTGSGILSMCAIRLGARSALAIDVDPVAVGCAREYLDLNGFGEELELKTASFEDLDPGEFDIVLANLEGKTLPALCGFLPRILSPGGKACFSGLQEQDYDAIADALSKTHLRVHARMQREEWLALEIRRGLEGPMHQWV
jgi:ribosomal protein L11 methyltransferase